ncbi:MAG: hypothetical protein QF463_04955 [Vicinamibacterales bacterium]|jgi:hypothetical protein|nr:hypothetical protein [Acidobacteriota bacterium]MDP6372574.1 hypothetical protein [Vicinamibacterales bacterium]MDP6608397.1 hypothetical protein [Vicinamibacterales bacterium]HAK55006.1 hypothetical protein [Acidobacteriota bacterium]|tara:strand:- start:319 stop:651 length:333 start_codon:yes stop_codon:yes gene_type:complete
MSFAQVGLAASLGARYPRFSAENAAQVSGSYGGVIFMISAVFFVILMIVLIGWPSSVYLYYSVRPRPIPMARQLLMGACFIGAAGISLATWWISMRAGVRALESMDHTPS